MSALAWEEFTVHSMLFDLHACCMIYIELNRCESDFNFMLLDFYVHTYHRLQNTSTLELGGTVVILPMPQVNCLVVMTTQFFC